MLEPWWERYPQMLQDEERDLERLAGRRPQPNDELLRAAAVRQYTIPYRHDGDVYDFTITYSDLHPYFRVEVTAEARFATHRHPFAGNLCLIRGGTWNWNVDETAAQLIESQMPLLLRDNGDPHAAGDDHVEPFVGYYTYVSRTAVRVDGSWADLTEASSGLLVIGVDRPPAADVLRGAVLEVQDDDGGPLRAFDESIASGYPTRLIGRWCRIPERPSADTADAVLEAAIAAAPAMASPRRERLDADHDLDIVGVVFRDGVRPGVEGDAWMFVVRGLGRRHQRRASDRQRGGRVTPPREKIGPYLARSFRAGPEDLRDRIPSVSALRAKKIVVFGAGGVGAPSAVEFAKAGVGTLAIVEFDFVDPATAPRWILGYQAAGITKLEAIHQLVRWNWPYTTLRLHGLRLGTPRADSETIPEWQILNEILGDADLVYDATAEVGVNYFLSELAKEQGLPYIVASTTEGGWGGRVARFRAGDDSACWTCLMHHVENNPDLTAPADPNPATATVWPAGCTDPTFTGTGFDIATIALAGVRLAVSTLSDSTPGGYPEAAWDVAVYSFRNDAIAVGGTAATFTLAQHADCEPCRIRRSG